METISINVSLGKEKLAIHLKMINAAEENRLRQRFVGLTEAEKEAKDYEINTSILSEYQSEKAEISGTENASEGQLKIDLKDYFKEKSVTKERIADYAVRAYLIALQPNIDFL